MRVVKIGGRAQSDARLSSSLAAAARAPGDTLCVVHGGGDEVSALQRRLGLEPQFRGGRRVTSADDLEIVRMVLSGTINKRLVGALLAEGVRAVGISGEDGFLFSAKVTDAAMGRVGGDVTVDATVVRALLSAGLVPVISPLARDASDHSGAGLNVNGDDAAAALAASLGADELVLVADVPGVLADGTVVPSLDPDGVHALIASGVAAGGMAAKLEAGIAALRGGAAAVRITAVDGIADISAGTRLLLTHSALRGAS